MTRIDKGVIDSRSLLKSVTVQVRLKHAREFDLRVRFGLWVVKLGVKITGMGFEYLGMTERE